jgi:hypothetical protein
MIEIAGSAGETAGDGNGIGDMVGFDQVKQGLWDQVKQGLWFGRDLGSSESRRSSKQTRDATMSGRPTKKIKSPAGQ